MHVRRFFRFFRLFPLVLLLLLAGCEDQPSESGLRLSGAELAWVGQRIFQNECASEHRCLVHWNRGEAFPSLGIGHFIWYPEGVDERFVESFPALISFMRLRSVELPGWLDELDPMAAPWADRDQFMAAEDSDQVRSLRLFLADTHAIQTEFIVARARASLGRAIAAAPPAEQQRLQQRLQALVETPGGTYAVIDYVNFKGEGLSSRERYNGEGWGLLQVLQQMDAAGGQSALQQFREAAAVVLTRRAHNARNPIERHTWLPGWLNRLQSYREPEV
ncbi:hypothetical protein BG841_05140 [Marinobacter sp. X15-166B]|nr:hypothetical protein BG841_05140 [Marinobacter sp. X15-166B]